jgi:hypothetical protein
MVRDSGMLSDRCEAVHAEHTERLCSGTWQLVGGVRRDASMHCSQPVRAQ